MQGRAESNDRKVVKKAQWQDDPADVPEDWPASVQYLRRPRLSSAVTPDLQKALRTPTRATAGYAKVAEPGSPNPLVRIIPITAPTHPAYGQHGLFATERLPPDSFILTYNGLLHTNDLSDTDLESNYDISMDRELGLSVDATHMGNEARFINDYRRVNEAPNAEFKDVWLAFDTVLDKAWLSIALTSRTGPRRVPDSPPNYPWTSLLWACPASRKPLEHIISLASKQTGKPGTLGPL
ncbi:hypothetical protein M8818_004370 [Zalaria obscura]|uniref:Uncharacterized protein n=1 Tax=Zalaria obscura TaxID=2024903 RepID=A0ACC3SBV5_9PEZI